MTLISIDAAACNKDGLCVRACPVYILRRSTDGVPVEAEGAAKRCIGCGHCVSVCPTGALKNRMTPDDTFSPLPAALPDADEIEALLRARRSVRNFRKAPVPRETLKRLLEAARRAPTASNSQNISWIVIEDPKRLARIRELTAAWMTTVGRLAQYTEAEAAGRDTVLRSAPVLAVACAPSDYAWCDSDSAIALTHMELMAAAMSVGACWGGLVTAACRQVPELAEVMGVGEGVRAGGAIMLGLPRNGHRRVTPRKPLKVDWL